MKKLITVFGPGSCKPSSTLYKEGVKLGALLAESGFSVITGGYDGVMEAVSLGARKGGARVIGVTAEVYFARGREANAYVTKEFRVKSAVDRLMELIDLADGYIALGNSPGTLIEVMTVWDYTIKQFIPKKPVLVMGEHWEKQLELWERDPYFKHAREFIDFATDTFYVPMWLTAKFGLQPQLPDLDILSN